MSNNLIRSLTLMYDDDHDNGVLCDLICLFFSSLFSYPLFFFRQFGLDNFCISSPSVVPSSPLTAVRFGRVPKREKAKILAAMQSVNARSQEKALEMELEDEAKLMSIVVKAHEDTCDYTKDKIAPLVQRARENPVYTQCTPQLVSTFKVSGIFFPTPFFIDFLFSLFRGRERGECVHVVGIEKRVAGRRHSVVVFSFLKVIFLSNQDVATRLDFAKC